jgi:plasmid stability protein
MVRTQIQLTDEQARKLRRRAKQRGISMSAMIRQCLDQGLDDQSPDLGATYQRAARLIGLFPDREGAGDLATGHDQYLEKAFR